MEMQRLKINQLCKVSLKKRELNQLLGAGCCQCGCNGPSTTNDNFQANYNYGYTQTLGDEKMCCCWEDPDWSDYL